MAALSTQTLGDTGAALSFAAASASDTAEYGNGSNTFLYVKNANAGSVTVTLPVIGNTFFGTPNPDNVIVIPTATDRLIPLRRAYDDGNGNGRATVTFSPNASVTVAVVRLA